MLWDLKGNRLASCKHACNVKLVAFSPEGEFFLTSSGREVMLWNLGNTALDCAVSKALVQNDTKILQLLLNTSNSLLKNVCKTTTLHNICHAASKVKNYQPDKYKHMCAVAHLIVQKCVEQNYTFLLNATDGNGKTPLHWTAWYDLPELVQLLLKANANIDVLDDQGNTPLHCAVKRNACQSVYLLLESGADPALVIDNDFPKKDANIVNNVILNLVLKYYVERS